MKIKRNITKYVIQHKKLSILWAILIILIMLTPVFFTIWAFNTQEIMFRYWASYIFSLMGIIVYIDKFTDLIKFIIECLTATEDECDFCDN